MLGFRTVFRKTLIDLTGWKSLLTLVVIGLLFPVLVMMSHQCNTDWGLAAQTHSLVDFFLMVFFIWTGGFFIAFLVSANAVGSISKEDAEGTLLFLVSKPVSRRHIVLAKLAAVVVRAVILETLMAMVFFLILRFLLPLEQDTFLAFLRTIPWLILYSLVIVVLCGTLSMALSALIRNQIVAMSLVSVAIIALFLSGAVVHRMVPDNYDDYHLYYVDPSYHLGNVFVPVLKQTSGGELPPASSEASDSVDMMRGMNGVFKSGDDSRGKAGVLEFFYPAELTDYVSPAVSLALFVMISGLALGLALWAMERKEVH
ncbi:MAG: ABC transporter permease [Chloroflexota bacterium]|nr:ABC transporter permease [Chloroflexota bacterium]